MQKLRTFLILGRVSNLPTVWSNCLAGWWLGSRDWDHDTKPLPLLLLGATLLYTGGMFLNDAFDANFDAQFRRERPIPSGAISAPLVWRMGFGLLAAGLICFCLLGKVPAILAFVLIACILLYDAIHKLITISPVLMAMCRFLLYVAAAATGSDGVTGTSVWCAFALGFYIVGLSYVAARESTRGALQYWPCLCLIVPIVLALLLNTNEYLNNALVFAAILGLWTLRQLRYAFSSVDRNVKRTVTGLLAGIVLVDLLAVADLPKSVAAVFFALFAGALLFQRFVPAT